MIRSDMPGLMVAFEGLDQSGKQTQTELLRGRLTDSGRDVQLFSFPDYDTVIGAEIGCALRGERPYGPDAMQLLYVANRYERKREMVDAKQVGCILLCDRYLAPGSSRSRNTCRSRTSRFYSTYRRTSRRGGRVRAAIGTSEIWPCWPAYGTAISAKRRAVGCGSTRTGIGMPSRPRCSPR